MMSITKSLQSTIAIVAFICVTCIPLQATAVADSAQEILDLSAAAMAPPIQFRATANNVSTMNFSKKMPDNAIATRIEIESPIHTIKIVYGEVSYEVFPKKSIVIDTSFKQQNMRSQIAGLSALPEDIPAAKATIQGVEKRHGINCYVISKTMPAKLSRMFAKTLPKSVTSKIPCETRSFVEQETYLLVEQETYSSAGKLISRMTYSEIKKPKSLPDDWFLPPNGYTVLKPNSIQEYAAMITDIASTPIQSHDLGPVKFDSNTHTVVAPVPPGMSEGEFFQRVDAARIAAKKERMQSANYSLSASKEWSSTRKISIYCTFALIVVLGVMLFKKWTR